MDAIVGYSGETVILWPYKSRIFSLSEIAKYLDFRALQGSPRFPNYITQENDIATAIGYGSQILKKYGPDILHGDITVLEGSAIKRS